MQSAIRDRRQADDKENIASVKITPSVKPIDIYRGASTTVTPLSLGPVQSCDIAPGQVVQNRCKVHQLKPFDTRLNNTQIRFRVGTKKEASVM